MRDRFYDRQGHPITSRAFWSQFRSEDIAGDDVGGAWVSTVWLGLDHRYGDGPPLIFETMVLSESADEDWWRYPTEAAALAGHDRIVTWLKAGGAKADRPA